MSVCINAQNITKSYHTAAGLLPVLSGADLKVNAGEFISISGPSGAGKSTLLAILGCLDTPDSGSLEIMGCQTRGAAEHTLTKLRAGCLGFVFQNYNLISSMTALQNVELGLRYRGVLPAARKLAALNALERVGLLDRADHLPGQLSGGQQQRVAVARALAAAPPVLLADEPTGNLDAESARAVMSAAKSLCESGSALIVITHDSALAYSAPLRYKLWEGRLFAQ